jgi:hypothetical protein
MGKSFYSIFIFLIFIITVIPRLDAADPVFEYTSQDRQHLFSLYPNLSEQELESLLTTGELTKFYREEVSLHFAPEISISAIIGDQLDVLKPTLGVEVLFLLPVSKSAITNPSFEIWLYNSLCSVSTMEGMKYYSASRDRMRLLFEESYVLDSAEDRNRIADPQFDTIPDKYTMFAFQKDLSFGKNIQHISYTKIGDTILMSMRNVTTMFYGIIPLIPPGNMAMTLMVHPLDSGLLFYGNTGLRVTVIPGIEKKSQNSFYNRIKALYSWLEAKISDEFT